MRSRPRKQSLRARLAEPSPPFVAHTDCVAAALASVPPARRAALLPPLLHLAANRLFGVDGARDCEAAAFYLWERTLESLARSLIPRADAPSSAPRATALDGAHQRVIQ